MILHQWRRQGSEVGGKANQYGPLFLSFPFHPSTLLFIPSPPLYLFWPFFRSFFSVLPPHFL